ncbi:UNKNOWN [Stylonychia lemnae]|uniref:Uncharacterized protein n=1 Tax=Stylonychia lemnae TaxID=5949 RepID=A0A077ZR11_STYLE|nr:UNKNOWN [Stylonychia lemnae]|eukprot:CDW71889.1 UNKNOWN [Stylonychia lemnae]
MPHITPLRIRSTSRENQNANLSSSFMSSNNSKIFGDANQGLDYIGLRINKDHASCNNHLYHPPLIQNTIPKPKTLYSPNVQPINKNLLLATTNASQNQPQGVNDMLNSMNYEFQRFIDNDLKSYLNDMKNQMFEQQFGFERQICQLFDKLQQDLHSRQPAIHIQQAEPDYNEVQLDKYALAHDLKIVEDDLIKLTNQIEDSLNQHSQNVQLNFDSQQNAIEKLSETIGQSNDQQADVNQHIQNQLQILQDRINSLEERLIQHDGQFDKVNIQIDSTNDDLENKIRKVKNELNQGIVSLSQEKTKELKDHERRSQLEHDDINNRINEINKLLSTGINAEKIQELEKLMNSQNNLQVINDIEQRLGDLEDNVQNQNQKVKQDLKNLQEKFQNDFKQDQLRQDLYAQQLREDCDHRIEQIAQAIEQLNKETREQFDDVKEHQRQMQIFIDQDQRRQDNDIKQLQAYQAQQEKISQQVQFLQEEQDKINQKQQEHTEHIMVKKNKPQKAMATMDEHRNLNSAQNQKQAEEQKIINDMLNSTLDQQQNEINSLNDQLRVLKNQILDQVQQQNEFENSIKQQLQEESDSQTHDNQLLEQKMNEDFNELVKIYEETHAKVQDGLLKQSDKLALLDKDLNDLRNRTLNKPKKDPNQKINPNDLEALREELSGELEDLKQRVEQQNQLTEKLNERENIQDQMIKKLQLDIQNQDQRIMNEIHQRDDNTQESLEQLENKLENIENKNLQLIQDIQNQILSIDDNTQQQFNQINDQINSYIADNDDNVRQINDYLQTNDNNVNSLQEQINQLQVKEEEQDHRLDDLESKFDIINQNQEALDQNMNKFHENICSDFNQMEDKVVAALQKDTVNFIHQTQMAPLEIRVKNLEKDRNMTTSQVMQQQIVAKKPPQISIEEEKEQMHWKLLNEMKNRRQWYLRKTAQDYIIEEIMLEKRCTQEKAEKIYLQRLEQKGVIRSNNPSPNGSKTRQQQQVDQVEGEGSGQFLGIKSINENIIHAVQSSPNRQGNISRASHSLSRNYYEDEEEEKLSPSPNRLDIMRKPLNPNNNSSLDIEADYDAANNVTPNKAKKNPYIVIKSPIHEQKSQSIQITPINKNKQQLTQQQNPNQLNLRQNLRETKQVNDDFENLSDVIEESNIDVDELDGNLNNLRSNLNILNDTQRNSNADSYLSGPLVRFRNRDSNLNDTQQITTIAQISPRQQQTNSTYRNPHHVNSLKSTKSNPNLFPQSEIKQSKLMDFTKDYNRNARKQGNQAFIQEIEEDWNSGGGQVNQNQLSPKSPAQNQMDRVMSSNIISPIQRNPDALFYQSINESALINQEDREFEGSNYYDYDEQVRQSLTKNGRQSPKFN